MTLIDLFNLSFRGRADSPALEYLDSGGTLQTRTFGELDQSSSRMAHVLAAGGLKSGDRLCVYLPNRVELIDIYIACLKLGVIFVPINILYRDREMSHILADAEPKAMVAEADLDAAVPVWNVTDLAAEARTVAPQSIFATPDGETPAAIVYTSGTTGPSKGAILTHNNFASNALNLLTCWQITEADRLLLTLPLFHVHGLANGLHCWLISGCLMRLQERFEHQQALKWFLEFEPTLFFGVPTIYVRLLDLPSEQARAIGASMRLFVSGSAPLPPAVLETFKDRYGHTILERYGMTETLMNMSNPYTGDRRPGTVGFPLPGISVEIRDEAGEPVRDGEPGELYLRGPNVFAGYWRRDEATRAAFLNGYFRTGDIGTKSADGYYTLGGRKSDLIISGGFNVYPREIEEFLLEQEGVSGAAVIGVPDRLRGEVPVAYVVCASDTDVPVIEQCCRTSLASFKVPRAFVRVESLPRTALGKVQKHLLPPVGKTS